MRTFTAEGKTKTATNASAAGLSESAHRALRQLIHFMNEGPESTAYREITGGAFPTSIIWYTDSGKTQKIVELTITRNGAQVPTVEAWKIYDTDGTTLLVTVTDTISYTGVFETSRERAVS